MDTVLKGIFSLKVVSNIFLASRDVKLLPFRLDMIVLASLSNFRGESPRAVADACGVPDINSTRSNILATFSLVTGPSIAMECLTPSGS
ncbi:MAG: hypothetical protein AUI50_00550 [Crenarchaeota archaeon 13_1_40CM_2_52_14]|nr:MAG: hypothetical protein AUI97_06450 [Crenarchaeota archaeon 13_1_40CM_3_52_17]OLD35844.1 MAG: hypothetical protein AUI50_00550 [Crenarchaeota archaeon 13_1_40CM_2_52_14]OLE69491.1 MAG: hypothetical protein AUF78_11095 [archaeon 13_1_20CM_2_51_12]